MCTLGNMCVTGDAEQELGAGTLHTRYSLPPVMTPGPLLARVLGLRDPSSSLLRETGMVYHTVPKYGTF